MKRVGSLFWRLSGLGETSSRLLALIDGARYLTLNKRLEEAGDSIRFHWLLSAGALDEIRHAGPVLVEFPGSGQGLNTAFGNWLISRDQQAPMVSWLWSDQPFETLRDYHQGLLFSRMPDGRQALFRYYSPEVRRALDKVVSPAQVQQLMCHVDDWLVWQPLQNCYLSYGFAEAEEHHV
ncbi:MULTISPECIES: DUF4123 domain-containing protein [Pseudomonas]|uniref:DUF4123 domain-containing protein n=1 Tax=Pseudomonas chlororaphis TaxID=587753 RepID=A0A0D5Y663_9PSED|nr:MULTISPECIES: DUF4123 domain-containing protein [Pseudomonas]AJO76700.1 hypothetical protein TO66_05120 [Pseudomonas sp. MRSN 12121]AKA26535.1 hypothetical protein PCL1606_50880 [Pseudomonas chlororaphis]MCB2251302.1 DUF4123 domain-containing protein [Pseudomonas chlororaphis]